MEAKKIRSPSYPSIDLETAVDKARIIQAAYRISSVDREALAKAIGYSSMSGTALQALASLISYGLLEKRGKGEAGISELAMRILFAESAEEHADSARQAALTPPAFAQVEDKFGGHIPHQDGVIAFLCRNGFTQKAGKIAARTYLNSMRFIGALGDSDRNDIGAQTTENLSPETVAPTVAAEERTVMMNQTSTVGEYRELVRGSVGGGNAFRLLGKAEFDADQWQDVMDMLEVQVKIATRRMSAQSPEEASATDDS